MNISAKRLEGETFEDYKVRRKAANKLVKRSLGWRRVKKPTMKELLDLELQIREGSTPCAPASGGH